MQLMSEGLLFADYCRIVDDTWPMGWRIRSGNLVYTMMVDEKESDLLFARKQDVDLAIKALAEVGITCGRHITENELTVNTWYQIALSGLQW